MKRNNMYRKSIKQWNPFVGCKHECRYCVSSFQRQMKRQKQNCMDCYNFKVHTHPERLNVSLPVTKYLQFIFTCSNGDVAFCETSYLEKIVDRIKNEPNKHFLIQSKNPKTFERIKFPNNVILGTTLETNRDELYKKHNISKAPLPSKRYKNFLQVNHPIKMVTIEPVLDCDISVMIDWIRDIDPVMVWLGYDSKNNNLPEPPHQKFMDLYWELGKNGYLVILKKVKKMNKKSKRREYE